MLGWVLATRIALGGDWADQDLDPKVLTDVTAYTVGKKRWVVGLVNQEYGLLSNAAIGTRAPLMALGIANAHAKVTAIQTPKFDAALSGEILAARLGQGSTVTVAPIAWTGSWITTERLSLHFGHGWTIASVNGDMTADKLADAVHEVIGIDVADDLDDAIGDTGIYAGANLTLIEARLAADYRFNRRDSIVVAARSFVAVRGLVGGGASLDVDDVDELELGTTARFRTTLAKTLPALVSVSWQFSWERFHLRVGIPMTRGAAAIFAVPQAFRLYWVLGPLGGPSMRVPDVPDPEEEAP